MAFHSSMYFAWLMPILYQKKQKKVEACLSRLEQIEAGLSVFKMFLNYFAGIFHNFLQRHITYIFVIVVILLISCKSMFKKL